MVYENVSEEGTTTYEVLPVTEISTNAFVNVVGYTNITRLVLDQKEIDGKDVHWGSKTNLTSIGDSAFSGCTNIAGTLTIPAKVTSIGQYAFNACAVITSLAFPEIMVGNLAIGASAFSSCTGILSVSLPKCNGKLYIGANAFRGANGATSIVLPKVELKYDENEATADQTTDSSISSLLVDDNAFRYMSNLDTVDFSQITFTNPTAITSADALKKAFFISDQTADGYARMFKAGIRTIDSISGAGYGGAIWNAGTSSTAETKTFYIPKYSETGLTNISEGDYLTFWQEFANSKNKQTSPFGGHDYDWTIVEK